MACGTGKTLVGADVAERLRAQTLAVFVPSLLLASQLLNVFRRQMPTARFLAACSDIDREASEEMPSVNDIGCPYTTERKEVLRFLRARGRRIVICTYHSARLLQHCKFDLAIFDEAHRTAGDRGKLFAFALLDENVFCRRRLFMTATPRHETISEEGRRTTEQFTMDDTDVYGPVFHSLPFRAAIAKGLASDYRIVVSVIKDRTTLNNPHEGTQVALRRAMTRYGAAKALTFHSTVDDAQKFVSSAPIRRVRLLHINGSQSSDRRRGIIDEFRQADAAWLSNARCLTEGVDAPEVDMIAFIARKRSLIDIVQAVGRALRPTPRKRHAVIFLPVFVRQHVGETISDAVHRAKFDTVYNVVQALREQDDILAAQLAGATTGGAQEMPIEIDTDDVELQRSVGDLAAIRRHVSVRLVRPFAPYTSAEAAKQYFLGMARRGDAKPNWKTDPLGNRRLMRLCNEDPGFYEATVAANPRWMRRRKTFELKQKLLAMIDARVARPSLAGDKREKSLYVALKSYTQPSHSCYDPKFSQEVERRCKRAGLPNWCLTRSVWLREELDQLLRTRRDLTGRQHAALRRHARADPAFMQKVQSLRPELLRLQQLHLELASKRAMQRLLAMIRKGAPITGSRRQTLFKHMKANRAFATEVKRTRWWKDGKSNLRDHYRLNAEKRLLDAAARGDIPALRSSFAVLRKYYNNNPRFAERLRATPSWGKIATWSWQLAVKRAKSSSPSSKQILAGRYMGLLRWVNSITREKARAVQRRDGLQAAIDFLQRAPA